MSVLQILHDNVEIVIYIMAILGALNELRKWYLKREEVRKKVSSVESDTELISQIYPILWHLLVKFKATRCYLIQYHNGDKFYTGQSIQRMTIYPEVINPEYEYVSPVRPNHENVLISNRMHYIQNKISNFDIYKINSISEIDELVSTEFTPVKEESISWMKTYKVDSLAYFKIKNKDNKIIAILCLEWNKPDKVTNDVVYYINEYKKRLETIFSKL